MEFLLMEALFGLFALVDAVDDESGLIIGTVKTFVGVNLFSAVLLGTVYVAFS